MQLNLAPSTERHLLVLEMLPYCQVVECDLDYFLYIISMDEVVNLKNKVNRVLTYPPYLARSEGGSPNYVHDILPHDNLEYTSDLLGDVLVYGGHIHIFFSTLQFSKWFCVLSQFKMHVPDRFDAPGKNMLEDSVFAVDNNPIIYIRYLGVYF